MCAHGVEQSTLWGGTEVGGQLEEDGISSQSVGTDLSAWTPNSFPSTHMGLHCLLPGSHGEARCPAVPAAFQVSLKVMLC